jgi:hypothetical protein
LVSSDSSRRQPAPRSANSRTHAADQDPDLQQQVGLLWLGEEYAQLEANFCDWRRSGAGQCLPEELNRSAFMAWIDCTL